MREISSLTHPLVKHLVSLRQSAVYRDVNNSVLVHGQKMVHELLSERPFRLLVVADERLIPSHVPAAEIIVANQAILEKITGVPTPEGIAAEVERPVWEDLSFSKRVLALDGISDPGNLGTLLRTALALGWDGVYLLDGCCDPYNDKALRASMGATFRLSIARGSWDELESKSFTRGWAAYVAELSGMEPSEVPERDNILLVLGNEARGPSSRAHGLCASVTIPMSGEMESLNVAVAGGILMYLLGPTSL